MNATQRVSLTSSEGNNITITANTAGLNKIRVSRLFKKKSIFAPQKTLRVLETLRVFFYGPVRKNR
jgi:hypothetical protein